jgi:hypothetical protein
MQRQVVAKMALASARDRLDKLAAEGIIPSRIAKKIFVDYDSG